MSIHGAKAQWNVRESISRHARESPERLALCAIDDDGTRGQPWTYRDLDNAISRVGGQLREQFTPGSAIAVWCDNSPEQVAWMLAGISAGLRVLMIHPLLTTHEAEAAIARAGACAVVSPVCRSNATTHLVASEIHDGPQCHDVSDWTHAGSIILLSSGTTGSPRLARRNGQSLEADGHNLAAAAKLTPRDGVLAAVPLSHSYGVDLVMATFVSGASLHIRRGGFEGGALHEYLAAGHVTVVPGVPMLFAALARESGAGRPRNVRLAFSAGSQFPPRLLGEVKEQWGMTLGHLYGATELGTVAFGDPGAANYCPLSVGFALDGVHFRVVDPEDPAKEMPAGAEGELCVRAPSMLCEYLDGPIPSVGGYFLTGDLGHIDHLGRIYVTGRLKHIIDTGGLKVNPVEVESVFQQHHAIADCALVPMALSDTVNKLRLLFVPREPFPDALFTELRTFGRSRLAPYKIPRSFQAVTSLPRSPSGKLLRHLLVAM